LKGSADTAATEERVGKRCQSGKHLEKGLKGNAGTAITNVNNRV
jgi:hypothetical protein